MRTADYIVKFIRETVGCDHIFLVTGGGMMFLSDAVACNNSVTAVCTHHEQAAAMAAVGYAKYTNKFGCAMVTTGCGGTNAVTGLLNAWQDGAKVIFISGQVKRKQTISGSGLPLRQFGVQEADIISIVKPITKYAVMVEDPQSIAFHLEKAVYLASEGTPGPVWLDIPMDVQGAVIQEDTLTHFQVPVIEPADVSGSISLLETKLSKAERPVILAGQGIYQSDMRDEFYKLIAQWNIPVVTSFLGGNSISGDHPNYIGRIGTKGNRAGNLTIQNADFILVLGCRLSVSSTGHEYSLFAREAEIMVVDIDPSVYQKNTVKIDHFCNADLRTFLPAASQICGIDAGKYLEQAVIWKKRYPQYRPEFQDDSSGINLYCFLDALSRILEKEKNAAVVSDAGSAFYATTQAVVLNDSQRYITSGGQAEMGFSLPAAAGVSAAAGKHVKVAAITGDGSLQMNIQELQTLKEYQFPVKLFVWNNNGYLSIRATQRKFFDGRFIGTDQKSGVSFPDLQKIAEAYGLAYVRIERAAKLIPALTEVFMDEQPVICEIMCDPEQEIVPSVSTIRLADGTLKSLPLEDMYPFLEWETLCSELFVKPVLRT